MKVGMTLQLTSFGSKPDLQTYQEELSVGDMAERLGFDSIWTLDHHFTGYVMSPDPVALLMYVAGRTQRIQLGTAVIVLPWHDPVEVAEKIALLDLVSGGRTIYGFGRGAASIVPEIQIRPRAISHPENRFYASSVSPESAEIMAKLGFGVLIIAQRSWEDTAADYRRYCEAALASGHQPRPPIGLFNVLVADDAHEAEDLAAVHMGAMFDSIDRHYRFSDGHLSSVKGYEFYAKLAKTYTKLSADEQAKAKAVEFYRSLHAAGTAAQVLEKFRYIHHTVPLEHAIGTFAFGGLPYAELERSFKLFAEKVLPVLQKDPAFQLPKEQTRYAEVGAQA